MNEDFVEITRRRYEYALGIDTRDFELLRSVFTDQITMDFEDYSGHPKATLPADEWVGNCRVLFNGLEATQHVMTNPMVDVEGDRARCRMYMQADHFLTNQQGDDSYTLNGYYTDELVRNNGKWLIEAVTLKLFWQRGNRQIMTLALQNHS